MEDKNAFAWRTIARYANMRGVLIELLKRRRACRAYTDEAVPRALIDQVVAAAERAPTASNVPYRHLLVVEHRAVIAAVRQVNPALLADPPCLLVVMSDLAMARSLIGPIGERAALIDSGAAAENAWLQAIELGLASQFTMVSAHAAVAAVLDLPESIRVDVMLPLGYADGARRPKNPARRAPAKIHQDRFGHVRA